MDSLSKDDNYARERTLPDNNEPEMYETIRIHVNLNLIAHLS